MSTITIASIEVKPGRSVAVSTENRRFGFFQDKAAQLNLQVGGTYEVETTCKEVNGKTLTNIVKAKQVAAGSAPPATPFVSGAYRENSHASAPDSHASKAEQIFVQGILQAMIRAGKVEVDKQALWSATQMLRGLWKHTFGFDSVHQHLEAAE